jgi:hypothetical protein
VIVNNFHVVRIAINPTKAKSKLIVNPHAMLALALAFERFQLIPRRTRHIGKDDCAV